MSKPVMMFMTLQPMAASIFCAGRVRARRLRPMRTLYLRIATSTSDLRPYWTARCQPSRPRSLIIRTWRSRRVGAPLYPLALPTATTPAFCTNVAMKAKAVIEPLADLGVARSHIRPQQSNN